MINKTASDILYPLLIVIGLVLALFLIQKYFKSIGKKPVMATDFQILVVASTAIGLVFALLFQNLYDFIEDPSTYTFTWGLTFFGGLIGGVVSFFAGYFLFVRKKYPNSFSCLSVIAGGAIPLAHAMGRVGCFLAGCCYGKPIDETSPFAWMGIKFLTTDTKVYPTNLMEALFLFVLAGVLIYLAFKLNSRLTLGIYCVSYGVFRFLIEYLRGDHRGNFIPGISPSQFWALLLIVLGIVYIVYLIVKKETRVVPDKEEPEPKQA